MGRERHEFHELRAGRSPHELFIEGTLAAEKLAESFLAE
jgi:hypothetical protein